MVIRFTSLLQTRYRDDLESLVFFNTNQSSVSPSIVDAINKYGVPQIMVDGDSLRLALGDTLAVQALYALAERGKHSELAGAIIYTRIDIETIVLLHMAVKDDYSFIGRYSREMLAMKLFNRLRAIAHQIKGVRSLKIMYGDGSDEAIDVSR